MVWSKKAKNESFEVKHIPPPTFLHRMEEKRAASLEELHNLDLAITKLEADIAWLKRHPEAESVLSSINSRFSTSTFRL